MQKCKYTPSRGWPECTSPAVWGIGWKHTGSIDVQVCDHHLGDKLRDLHGRGALIAFEVTRLEEPATAEDRGVYEKYRVERTDGKPIEWCFVLEIDDPLARAAMVYYAHLLQDAEKDKLADDLFTILDAYRRKRG